MKKHLNTLFVTTQGSYLAKDGETVAVRIEKETKLRIPVHTLDGIICFGNVGCSPFLMGFCAERDVSISFLTEYGRFLARVVGPVSGNVLLRREQYRRADDPDQSKGQDDKVTHVVFENRGNREGNELELEFRRVCDGTNWFSRHLPFDIVFASKKINSGGLQFADLAARPVGLSILRPGQPNRAFEVLKGKFYCSDSGNSNGWGLKCFP